MTRVTFRMMVDKIYLVPTFWAIHRVAQTGRKLVEAIHELPLRFGLDKSRPYEKIGFKGKTAISKQLRCIYLFSGFLSLKSQNSRVGGALRALPP